MLLPQVCLATNANIIIFHCIRVFVQALVRNLFFSGRVEVIPCVLRQRHVTEFCVMLGRSGEGILEMLQNVCGAEAVSQATVF